MACCIVAVGLSLILHRFGNATKIDPNNYLVEGLPEADADFSYNNVHSQTLRVTGMTCSSCTAMVESAALDVAGVTACRVSLFESSVVYTYDPTIFNQHSDVVDAISRTGYDAILEKPKYETADHNVEQATKSYQQTIECLIYAVVTFGAEKLCVLGLPGRKQLLTIAACAAVICQWKKGTRFYLATWYSLRHRHPLTMDALVGFSTTFALLLSLSFYVEFLRFDTPESLANIAFEISTGTLLVITVGKHLEEVTKIRLNSNILSLQTLLPRSTIMLRGEKSIHVCCSVIKEGDTLMVMPGMKFPCDGTVTKGQTFVDELVLTGEPLPVKKHIGSYVLAGTLNKYLSVEISARGPITGSAISKLCSLTDGPTPITVLDPHSAKSLKYFIPGTILFSVCTLLYWSQFDVVKARMRALAVVSVACPCALGLAMPAALVRGMNVAATKGIFIRGSGLTKLLNILREKSNKPPVFVFDKTGTLTTREVNISEFKWLTEVSTELKIKFFSAVYSIEHTVEHPIAAKVAQFAFKNLKELNSSAQPYPINNFQLIEGGISCEVNLPEGPTSIRVSNDSMTLTNNTDGELFFVLNNMELAKCKIETLVRQEAKSVLEKLQKEGYRVLVASGDLEFRTASLSRNLLISENHSNLTPQDKAQLVSDLSEKNLVIMIGDGLNDLDAFKKSSLAIAVVSAHQLAVDSADIVFMNDSLSLIEEVLQLGLVTERVRALSVRCCIAYNVLMIPIAMGCLSSFGINISPYYSSVFMSMSTLVVLVNCLWIR